jgi:hypothetical protein
MITEAINTRRFEDIRDLVAYYGITPINQERWDAIAGWDDIEEYYELYHPNIEFTCEKDIFELELGKIEGRNFLVIEYICKRHSSVVVSPNIIVVELPMPKNSASDELLTTEEMLNRIDYSQAVVLTNWKGDIQQSFFIACYDDLVTGWDYDRNEINCSKDEFLSWYPDGIWSSDEGWEKDES